MERRNTSAAFRACWYAVFNEVVQLVAKPEIRQRFIDHIRAFERLWSRQQEEARQEALANPYLRPPMMYLLLGLGQAMDLAEMIRKLNEGVLLQDIELKIERFDRWVFGDIFAAVDDLWRKGQSLSVKSVLKQDACRKRRLRHQQRQKKLRLPSPKLVPRELVEAVFRSEPLDRIPEIADLQKKGGDLILERDLPDDEHEELREGYLRPPNIFDKLSSLLGLPCELETPYELSDRDEELLINYVIMTAVHDTGRNVLRITKEAFGEWNETTPWFVATHSWTDQDCQLLETALTSVESDLAGTTQAVSTTGTGLASSQGCVGGAESSRPRSRPESSVGEMLTEADLKILAALSEAHRTMSQIEIEVAVGTDDKRTGLSRRTIGKRLPLLEEKELVARPHGPRKGYAIREKGKIALASK